MKNAFASGGVVVPADGKPHFVSIQRVGQCVHGFCVYEIDGTPQHIASRDEVASGDTRKLTCPCGGQVVSE